MSEDLNPYIEAGKSTAAHAEALQKLTPGAFVTHRSWGFGKIAAWELITGQITIDFGSKTGHPMQLQYAAETLTFIPGEPCVEIALELRNRALARGYKAQFTVGLANDYVMYFTPKQL